MRTGRHPARTCSAALVVVTATVLVACSPAGTTGDHGSGPTISILPTDPSPTGTDPTPTETGEPTPSLGFDPPGPPGPTIPDGLQGPVASWFALLDAHRCRALRSATTAALPTSSADDGSRDAALLYRAAAYACLERTDAARADLAQVDLAASAWQDQSCQPQVLLDWVRTYLDALAGDRSARHRLRRFPDPSGGSCVTTEPSVGATGGSGTPAPEES